MIYSARQPQIHEEVTSRVHDENAPRNHKVKARALSIVDLLTVSKKPGSEHVAGEYMRMSSSLPVQRCLKRPSVVDSYNILQQGSQYTQLA